jgi:hypothetical protein
MRIILYRYHNNIDFCIDRLGMIQKNNPGMPIYGLFGGKEEEYPLFDKALGHIFSGNYCIKEKNAFWKWKNSDLAYRLWFKDYGTNIPFSSLVVLEWDLILFESIAKIYQHVDENQVGLTGLVPLSKIEKEWFWTRDAEQRKFWLKLLDHVKTIHGYDGQPYGALCPGACLPRNFLEKYAAIEPSELCHDELRLPLYAQALGFELADTGFYKKWFSKKEWKYFNCNNLDISVERINKELKKNKGRRVFHPFREKISGSGFFF